MDSTNPFASKSTNPFEDDIDDDMFLRQSTSKFRASVSNKNPFEDTPGDKVGDAKEEVQMRTLASTEKSLAMLTESEAVGEGIAVELTEQREQLENCHRKVDDINANLRNSQKHLRRIKSFFGGLKDFLMGVRIKPVRPAASEDIIANPSVSHRSRSTTVKQTASSHPGIVMRASDGDSVKPGDIQTAIDRNLDQMLNHVVSLKGLAADLGEELENQNELIDSLNDKAEEAQISLGKQNKEIAKML